MKRLFCFIILISIFCLSKCPTPFIFYASSSNYAQIQRSNVYLFNDELNPIFEIPFSYYVLLLEKQEGEYYKCEYNDVKGYVKANEVQCVSSLTQPPYLEDVTFRVLASQSAEFRREPSRKKGLSTLYFELDLYETNFCYLGKIQGETVVPGCGDIWYYAKHIKNNVASLGYVYAGLCDQLSDIPTNTMNTNPIAKHEWIEESPETPITDPKLELPNSGQIIIIIAISLPVIILFIILLTNKKTTKITPQNTSSVITLNPKKARRGKDYYELE